MGTIANAKVTHYYNCYNGDFIGCLHITFIRSVKEGYVYAEAVEVFNHHRIPFIEVRLVDEAGELIGVMTSSGYRKDAK